MPTTDTAALELLPCPFCGGDAELMESGASQASGSLVVYRVVCSDCGMSQDSWDDRRSAIAAWNTRAQPPADDEMVVGLSDDRRDAIATQAVNERWPKGWSRSNKLAAMGMVRYAVDAAIAAMQPEKEG